MQCLRWMCLLTQVFFSASFFLRRPLSSHSFFISDKVTLKSLFRVNRKPVFIDQSNRIHRNRQTSVLYSSSPEANVFIRENAQSQQPHSPKNNDTGHHDRATDALSSSNTTFSSPYQPAPKPIPENVDLFAVGGYRPASVATPMWRNTSSVDASTSSSAATSAVSFSASSISTSAKDALLAQADRLRKEAQQEEAALGPHKPQGREQFEAEVEAALQRLLQGSLPIDDLLALPVASDKRLFLRLLQIAYAEPSEDRRGALFALYDALLIRVRTQSPARYTTLFRAITKDISENRQLYRTPQRETSPPLSSEETEVKEEKEKEKEKEKGQVKGVEEEERLYEEAVAQWSRQLQTSLNLSSSSSSSSSSPSSRVPSGSAPQPSGLMQGLGMAVGQRQKAMELLLNPPAVLPLSLLPLLLRAPPVAADDLSALLRLLNQSSNSSASGYGAGYEGLVLEGLRTQVLAESVVFVTAAAPSLPLNSDRDGDRDDQYKDRQKYRGEAEWARDTLHRLQRALDEHPQALGRRLRVFLLPEYDDDPAADRDRDRDFYDVDDTGVTDTRRGSGSQTPAALLLGGRTRTLTLGPVSVSVTAANNDSAIATDGQDNSSSSNELFWSDGPVQAERRRQRLRQLQQQQQQRQEQQLQQLQRQRRLRLQQQGGEQTDYDSSDELAETGTDTRVGSSSSSSRRRWLRERYTGERLRPVFVIVSRLAQQHPSSSTTSFSTSFSTSLSTSNTSSGTPSSASEAVDWLRWLSLGGASLLSLVAASDCFSLATSSSSSEVVQEVVSADSLVPRLLQLTALLLLPSLAHDAAQLLLDAASSSSSTSNTSSGTTSSTTSTSFSTSTTTSSTTSTSGTTSGEDGRLWWRWPPLLLPVPGLGVSGSFGSRFRSFPRDRAQLLDVALVGAGAALGASLLMLLLGASVTLQQQSAELFALPPLPPSLPQALPQTLPQALPQALPQVLPQALPQQQQWLRLVVPQAVSQSSLLGQWLAQWLAHLHHSSSSASGSLELGSSGALGSGAGAGESVFAVAGALTLCGTALSLLPVGRLPGGRLAQAIFGRRSAARLSTATLLLLALRLLSSSSSSSDGGVLLGFALAATLLGRQPDGDLPPIDDLTPPSSSVSASSPVYLARAVGVAVCVALAALVVLPPINS